MLLDHNFALVAAKISQDAAIACVPWIGKLDEKSADLAAVESMRKSLNMLDINAYVVIGEGERDQAPMLYIGEKLGKNDHGKILDIALDPLEGTTICAHGRRGSMCVIAFAQQGNFLNAPDVYMEKIAIGANLPEDIIDLDNTVKQNLANLARAKKCDISDLQVLILKRDRHMELIAKVVEEGARVQLIDDGDIAAVIATCFLEQKIDMYLGIGGAPEGVLAAAALRATGGQLMGRLLFDNDSQRERAGSMGIKDLNRKYLVQDMAKGDVIFAATGVTDGNMLKGVSFDGGIVTTNTLIMISKDKTMLNITNSCY